MTADGIETVPSTLSELLLARNYGQYIKHICYYNTVATKSNCSG